MYKSYWDIPPYAVFRISAFCILYLVSCRIILPKVFPEKYWELILFVGYQILPNGTSLFHLNIICKLISCILAINFKQSLAVGCQLIIFELFFNDNIIKKNVLMLTASSSYYYFYCSLAAFIIYSNLT